MVIKRFYLKNLNIVTEIIQRIEQNSTQLSYLKYRPIQIKRNDLGKKNVCKVFIEIYKYDFHV